MTHPDSEQLLLRVLGITLIVAALAENLHASAAVGAFLVGLTLTGETATGPARCWARCATCSPRSSSSRSGCRWTRAQLLPMLPIAVILAGVTAATKVATGMFAARRDGVARRGQLRAGTTLIARGEFSLIIIGLVGSSVAGVAALATSYVFVLAIVGPVLTRFAGGPICRRREVCPPVRSAPQAGSGAAHERSEEYNRCARRLPAIGPAVIRSMRQAMACIRRPRL